MCSTCSRIENSVRVPRGWYTLKRRRGLGMDSAGLGVFCSAECLAAAMPRIKRREEHAGERFGLPREDAPA